MSDFKGCESNEEGLVIATGGEGEEGEKANLKICLAWKLNLGPASRMKRSTYV